MTRTQWMIIVAGALILALHALFPPRVYRHDTDQPVARAFVFSRDFYDTDITTPTTPPDGWVDQGKAAVVRSSNPCVMGWDRFVTTAVAIAAATVLCLGVAGAFRKRGT